jgi:hypothetical protein
MKSGALIQVEMIEPLLVQLFRAVIRLSSVSLVIWIGIALIRLKRVKQKYAHLPQLPSNFLFGNLGLFLGNFPFKNTKSINQRE